MQHYKSQHYSKKKKDTNSEQKFLALATQNVSIPFDKFSITFVLRKIQNFHFLKFRTETCC